MNSDGFSADNCFRIVEALEILHTSHKEFSKYLSRQDVYQLQFSCNTEWGAEISDRYSEPIVWIGIYIAIASFICILAMSVDLFHGFQNKKLWFPCKYFSLNAASITIITIAMKLPVDLSSAMPGYPGQATKLGSLGFMCAMMANLIPSLASMDSKTLLANVISMSILVITIIVNVFIQISTGAIGYPLGDSIFYVVMACIYMAMILLLLVILISSSLTLTTCKEILEFKYQATNKRSLSDPSLQRVPMSKVEKLRQHLRRYWVMAETGSPQFVMASNPLSTASGLICVIILIPTLLLVVIFSTGDNWKNAADTVPYKWSIVAIFVTQSIGVVVGTVAPIFRCFSVFNFKLVITKWNKNRFVFFEVEKYWTQKLHEWKQSPIPFLPISRRSRSIISSSKDIVLSLSIGFQNVVVVSCKLIWFITTVVVGSCLYCLKSLMGRWFTICVTPTTDYMDEEDLSKYVLQIDNDVEIAEETLRGIANSMNHFILMAAKEQDNHLFELLEKSTGFKGVEMFDADHVQPLLPVEHVNSWSLSIVTLTCIAVALPNISNDTVESLFKSVGEGLSYTHLVEESLNCSGEYANLRKASMALWHEVEHKCKWLDNPLAKRAFEGKTATEIIKWFSNKAKNIVIEINKCASGELMESPLRTSSIAANSMYRITQTILLKDQSNIEPITEKQLFAHLNGMIADIFSACFTNLPRVINMRCHESVIEKREASVKVAAKLLGKTRKIIERLETLELPNMDDEKMAYIDEWRLYLKQCTPP